MTYRILHLGEEPLRERSLAIEEIHDDLRMLVRDMFTTMYEANGCGLAAPQIGNNIRLVVIDLGDDPIVMINPEIINRTGKETASEGCLSLPGISELVERASKIVATAVDIDGSEYEIETEGLLARAIQHEIDHLDGVLFIDRISKARRLQIKKELEQIEAGEVVERRPSKSPDIEALAS